MVAHFAELKKKRGLERALSLYGIAGYSGPREVASYFRIVMA